MLGDTPTLIVNRALQLIGDNQPQVTGKLPNFDTSPAGVAASLLYTQTVRAVARTFGFDFSRNVATLAASGGSPPPEWPFEYAYPTIGVEVRQVMPATIVDPNNPIPVRWTVGMNTIGGVPTKVIWTNLATAVAKITAQPPEALWDSLFTEAVERALASELAMAISGRPNTAAAMLESARDFEQVGETRNG